EVVDVDHYDGHRLAATLSAMQFAGEHVFEVAPVVQTRESVAQRHLAERIAQFEIGERRANSVGHRTQAQFRVLRRTSGAWADVDGNVKQAEDLALAMDRHADVALGVVVRMPASNGAFPRGEMGTNEPYMNVPTPQMRSRMRKVRTCESHTLGGRSRTVTRVNVTQDSCGAYVAGALILRLSASADAERAPLLRRALFAAAPASQKPNPFTT